MIADLTLTHHLYVSQPCQKELGVCIKSQYTEETSVRLTKYSSTTIMKASAFVLLFLFCYVECRKAYVPIDKNANLAFINMEGGGVRPGANVQPPAPAQRPVPPSAPAKQPAAPQTPPPTPKPAAVAPPVAKPPQTPASPPVPAKPAQPAQPAHPPSQIKPVPVNPAPVAKPITTPGPGTVKQLVNFYDSQGKASPIRPYSYSSAVKQG